MNEPRKVRNDRRNAPVEGKSEPKFQGDRGVGTEEQAIQNRRVRQHPASHQPAAQGVAQRKVAAGTGLSLIQDKLKASREELNPKGQKLQGLNTELHGIMARLETLAPMAPVNAAEAKMKADFKKHEAALAAGQDLKAQALLVQYQHARLAWNEAKSKREGLLKENENEIKELGQKKREIESHLPSVKRDYSELIQAHEALLQELRNLKQGQPSPELDQVIVQVEKEVQDCKAILAGKITESQSITPMLLVMLFAIILGGVALYSTNNLNLSFFTNLLRMG